MIKKITIIIIIFVTKILAFAENPCNIMVPRGEDEDWGIGCYLMPDEYRIQVYDDSDGTKFGEIFSRNSHIQLIDRKNNRVSIAYGDIEYLGSYRNEFIKIKECFNPNYVRILWKTNNKTLYISKDQLSNVNAEFKKYRDILFDNQLKEKYHNYNLNIGVNIENNCLNLRESPKTNSNVILCIKGNDWDKTYETGIRIKEVKGDWAKIEYFEMHANNEVTESDEDCNYIEKNNKFGWIKAIADNGFPNIWFSVSGY